MRFLVPLLCSALLALPACAAQPPRPDPRAEIRGHVVDAATGAPIEGVAVFAAWRTELPPSASALAGIAAGGHGGAEWRVVKVLETLTDAHGLFVIPAWPEREQLRPGTIVGDGPVVGFFKPGYEPTSMNAYWIEAGVEPSGQAADARTRRMRLFRYGTRPQPQHVVIAGASTPSLEQAALRQVTAVRGVLERHVMYADDPDAPADSPPRRAVREAQRRSVEMAREESQRLRAAAARTKSQGEGR